MAAGPAAARLYEVKLLIGFDGSEGARDAVELARWLSAGESGEALLVNVVPHPGPLPVAYQLLGEGESRWAEQLFRQPTAALSPLPVRWRNYVGGSPAHILTDIAEEEEIDLIVIGSPHRGALGRALLGSVAQGVLHGSPVPVAVAPRGHAGERHGSPRTIAVANDGSSESERALRQAESLARRLGAALELLTVATVPPPEPSLAGFRFDPVPSPDEVIQRGLDAVADDVRATARELHADSVAVGLAEGCEGADLLVAGSRGYGVLGRVLVGSVTTELIRLAPCPVLVVPRPDEEKD